MRTADSMGVSAAVLLTMATAATPAAESVPLLTDLTAVIMLLGLPCETVTGAARLADNDHLATCSNGTRYRVYMNSQGRVVAEKQ